MTKKNRVDRHRVQELLDKGWSASAVARILKISTTSVSKLKNADYQKVYMTELRKEVRDAVRTYFKDQRRKRHKLYEVEERTHLQGKDEEELLSILENVGGDQQLVLEKVREASDWAIDAEFANWRRTEGELTEVEKEEAKVQQQEAFEESLRFMKRLRERDDPKLRKEKFRKLKV